MVNYSSAGTGEGTDGGDARSTDEEEEDKLMEFITHAEAWMELQQLYRKHTAVIEPRYVAAMIVRTAQVHTAWQATKQPKMRAFLAELAAAVGRSLLQAAGHGAASEEEGALAEGVVGSPEALSACEEWVEGAWVLVEVLGALGALRVWRLDAVFLEQAFRVLGCLEAFTWRPRQFAMAAFAAGALRQAPAWLVTELTAVEDGVEKLVAIPMQWHPNEYAVEDLTLLLQGYSALRLRPPPLLLEALVQRMERHRLEVSASHLSTMITLLAELGHSPGMEWMEAVLGHLLDKPGWKQPADLANVVCALGHLGHRPSVEWLQRYTALVLRFLDSYAPRDVVVTLQGLAALGHRPDDTFFELAMMQLRGELKGLTNSELAELLATLRRLGFTPRPRFCAALALEVQRWGRTKFAPADIPALLHAIGDGVLPQTPKLLQKVQSVSGWQLPDMSPDELLAVAGAFADLRDLRPGDAWLRQLEAAVGARVVDLEPQQAAESLCVLYRLRWAAGAKVLEQLLAVVTAAARRDEVGLEALLQIEAACHFWSVDVPPVIARCIAGKH